MTTRRSRVASSPLLRCLALGSAIAWTLAWVEPPPVLEPDAAELQAAVRNWTRLVGRAPGPVELEALQAETVTDEVLYREALVRHFDRLPVVRERLLRLATFLELVPTNVSVEAQVRAAVDLGLDRSDPIIRRYMIGAMRQRLVRDLDVAAPTRADSEAAYHANPERTFAPGAVAFRHVYIGGLEPAARARALALAERLRESEMDPARAIGMGDAFYGGHVLPLLALPEIDQRFGPGFAVAVAALAVGEWSDPIPSAYGHHLVWKDAERLPGTRPFEAVEPTIVRRLYRERTETALRHKLLELRARYRVVAPAGSGRAETRAASAPEGSP